METGGGGGRKRGGATGVGEKTGPPATGVGEKTGPSAIVSMEEGGKTGPPRFSGRAHVFPEQAAVKRWTAMARATATAPEVGSPPDECPSSRSFLRFGLRSTKW